MMFMTPKISVSPLAMRAYTPPMSRPSARACTNCVKESLLGIRAGGAPGGPCEHGPPGRGSLPGRLLDRGVDRRGVVRRDDLDRSALPLAQQELALRCARLVPRERAEDGLDLVGVQPLGQLDLVVELPD